ncbi:MAG: malic enzyme-like NAD(P)-binding protein [Nanoarchaeota archaeon]|nr:NAD-dependent malic enzyme [Nanoarchaeota archaeon]MBU4300926.1 NAD-dependent malic enzyme [Nanoarchaeota archaeon]MBU4451529.1 NAD-dependent malic enzyme [Nanoarchaeota archaeon]MCG2723272.1 NAD-dependent malic enzyme [archaeon]
MNYAEESLKLHAQKKGKMEIKSKVALATKEDLSLAYTPGVAAVSAAIAKDKSKVYEYTSKGNTIAILTDGSRVLGLGNIGPEAALPVMEGKAILFKEFGGVDAFPICLATQDIEEIIKIAHAIAPVFGGINLEDIDSPKCFEIEERLKKELDIPVMHDDQHGTAIAIFAGLLNALKLTKRKIESAKIVIQGAGAAGNATTKLLVLAGAKNVIVCDSRGAIYAGRFENMDNYKIQLAAITNKGRFSGSLADAVKGADFFVGVSAPNTVTLEMVKSMAKDPIIFALANPVPEITAEIAKEAGAKVIATGRSDCPNQINNVLCFPGIFRGALDSRAKEITEEMKLAAARAIAGLVSDSELREEYIIPSVLDRRVAAAVADAVKKAGK